MVDTLDTPINRRPQKNSAALQSVSRAFVSLSLSTKATCFSYPGLAEVQRSVRVDDEGTGADGVRVRRT